MFLVPSLPDRIGLFSPRFHFLYRLRPKAAKQRFFFALKGHSDAPEVIYDIARRLWTMRSGFHHAWNPNMSDEFNLAVRQLSEAGDLLRDAKAQDPCVIAEAARDANAQPESDRSRIQGYGAFQRLAFVRATFAAASIYLETLILPRLL